MELRSYSSLIWSEHVVRKFYSVVLGTLESHEINFVSIAARKKYLSAEEQQKIRLGKTQMLGKTLVLKNEADYFINKLFRLDAESSFYTDYDGNIIPKTCMSFYLNLNPSNVLKALCEFKVILANYDMEASHLLKNGNEQKREEYLGRVKTLVNKLYSCFQVSRGTKRWLDLDIDVEGVDKQSLYDVAVEVLRGEGIIPVGVATRGGLHILLKTEDLREKHYNPQILITRLKEFVDKQGASYKEIIINKNEMIPIPGTFQGNFPVYMLLPPEEK